MQADNLTETEMKATHCAYLQRPPQSNLNKRKPTSPSSHQPNRRPTSQRGIIHLAPPSHRFPKEGEGKEEFSS